LASIKNNIRTIQIDTIAGNKSPNAQVFFANDQADFQRNQIQKPYRSNYYGIGLCQSGKATLNANLDTYTIAKDCMISLSPQVVKQWMMRSKDYQTLAIFFTKEFFIQNNTDRNILDNFSFFDANAKHVIKINKEYVNKINQVLQEIQYVINSANAYKNEIVRSYIQIILYEISALYNQDNFKAIYKQTRGVQITDEFKRQLNMHFIQQRSVQFYAELLFITAKHLTETIKNETGKSAKEWIDEMVVLEAKVLLQDNSLSIANIADSLHFADQSTFGKYFKNLTGISPVAYKQSL
jgi:AraC family transcriptional regulator, transcriptional activator of pobA